MTNKSEHETSESPQLARLTAHSNGGGLVAETASVSPTVFVAPEAKVLGRARVEGYVCIIDRAVVADRAVVSGEAFIAGDARIFGDAAVWDNVWVLDHSSISGVSSLHDDVVICGRACVEDRFLEGSVVIGGELTPEHIRAFEHRLDSA